jgi:glycosyltransferase involved in cell wall biosynthesis
MVTNRHPMWAGDYPRYPNFKVLIRGKSKIPEDFDLIVTDGKREDGDLAIEYKRLHPNVVLAAFSFETKNWVQLYDKIYAEKLNTNKPNLEHADMLIANSSLSMRYLKEWVKTDGKPSCVLPPAVNDTVTGLSVDIVRGFGLYGGDPPRPYAVWSSRAVSYKGGDTVLESIMSLPIPFDLVLLGQGMSRLPDTADHHVVMLKGANDRVKYSIMKYAHMVLAPSRFEGYGMVPGEAMSVGTPCVAYELPVLREEYKDEAGLIFVKYGDAREFSAMVKDMATKPKMKVDPIPTLQRHGMEAMKKRIATFPYHVSSDKKSITAHLIAYWGVLPESLASVYPYVDKILVAFGPVRHASPIEDGSLQVIRNFPDPDHKIVIEHRDLWNSKDEMRQWCAKHTEGTHVLLLDGDEVWVGLDKWIASGIDASTPRWINFWHDEKHWIYDTEQMGGARWGRKLHPFGSSCPHYRWSWWRPSNVYATHTKPTDAKGVKIFDSNPKAAASVPECAIYHFGHMLPKNVMAAKHRFYLGRDGDNAKNRARRDCWMNWNGKLGDCGDGIVAVVDWELPELVKKAAHRLSVKE